MTARVLNRAIATALGVQALLACNWILGNDIGRRADDLPAEAGPARPGWADDPQRPGSTRPVSEGGALEAGVMEAGPPGEPQQATPSEPNPSAGKPRGNGTGLVLYDDGFENQPSGCRTLDACSHSGIRALPTAAP